MNKLITDIRKKVDEAFADLGEDSTSFMISSKEIAELTGKRHKNVLRDIRDMAERRAAASVSEGVYKATNGEDKALYWMGPKDFLILMSGYNKALRFSIMEALIDTYAFYAIPVAEDF